jgi:hypothetical protein
LLSSWAARSNFFLGTQVVRYSALLGGVFYGIAHRRTLQKEADAAKLEHAVHQREHLIAEAKEAWKKKQAESKNSDGSKCYFFTCILAHDPHPCHPPFLHVHLLISLP